MDLMKIGTSDASVTSTRSYTSNGNAGEGSSSDLLFSQLERIVATPAESVAGYFECLGIFKVFAATFAPECTQIEKRGRYNVKVRPVIEPGAVIHIDVTESIRRDEQLVSNRLLNETIV
ncbi:hypothetical protein TraAM80_00804 [Trypanosoma rangeli]|uniref:Uncharacterized protein n=1 Tax=Trypanosoma rangeli TaxID=5698 RepID=A0A3R7M9U3_TRYRA|nr:uncharacterized protein TraAM80_00804 [Trypanosoma rangeli]RNF11612.1 hypothetical protein TraAM80_00804 [Trypanosoma rangeli]|eukprot:RNF11612.1 hypothetical protein TraAM80_00804 [Trypanosoma rangeli]